MEDDSREPRELVRLSEGYFNIINDRGTIIGHFKLGDKVIFNDGACGIKPSFYIDRIVMEMDKISLEHIKRKKGIIRSMNISNIKSMEVVPSTPRDKILKIIDEKCVNPHHLARTISSKTVYSTEAVLNAIYDPNSVCEPDRTFIEKNIMLELARIGIEE